MKKTFQHFSNFATLWLIIAASFSINLPVAFGSVCLLLFLMFWIISGNFSAKFGLILNNPGAMISLAMLGLYAVGVTYSSAPWHDSLHYLMKYAKLLIIPLIIGIVVSSKHRKYAINGFLISLIGYLIVSYLNWMGFFSFGLMHHGTYMALGLYLMLVNARRKYGLFRLTWIILASLTAFNILFIADVRTAVITMWILLFIFFIETWGFKKGLFYLMGLIFLTFIVFQITPSAKQSRLIGVKQEASVHTTSAGMRLEMYKNTLTLIIKNPIFGAGTGSIEGEYLNLIKDSSLTLRRVTNPHNQYLLTTQELGLFGLLMLISFWIVHFRQSYTLGQDSYGRPLRALIIMTVVGSMFNSLMLDSGDGRMYCILTGIFLSSYKPKSYT